MTTWSLLYNKSRIDSKSRDGTNHASKHFIDEHAKWPPVDGLGVRSIHDNLQHRPQHSNDHYKHYTIRHRHLSNNFQTWSHISQSTGLILTRLRTNAISKKIGKSYNNISSLEKTSNMYAFVISIFRFYMISILWT